MFDPLFYKEMPLFILKNHVGSRLNFVFFACEDIIYIFRISDGIHVFRSEMLSNLAYWHLLSHLKKI